MNFFRFSVFLATWLCTTAHAETLTIFGDDSYTPVIYLRNGSPAGVLPAILSRVETMTGDTYVVKLFPWKRAYELASRGEGGVIGVSFNQERAKLFDFSKSMYDDDIQIVTLASHKFTYHRIDDLRGKVVGGVIGASYGDEIDKAIAAGVFKMDRDIGQEGRLRKLLAGRLDAAFIGNGNVGFDAVINSSDELRSNRDKLVVLPQPLTRDPLHLAFAKSMNKGGAIDRFDAAVEKLRKSGDLKKLLADAAH